MRKTKEEHMALRIDTETKLIIETLADARKITVSEALRDIIRRGLPSWIGPAERKRQYNQQYSARRRASLNNLRAGDHIILPDGSEGILEAPLNRKAWTATRVSDGMSCTVFKNMIRLPEPT